MLANDQNPLMPDALRALLPINTPASIEDAHLGMAALGALLKQSKAEASWQCPDCGGMVEPQAIPFKKGYKWLPRGHCNCSDGSIRFERIRSNWHGIQNGREQARERYEMLKTCDLEGTGMTFGSWRKETPAQEKAERYARRMVQRLSEDAWSLWWGPYGCGKTHLAHACATELVLQHGKKAIVVNWLRQLREIQATWNNNEKDGPLWQSMLKVPVLFLDDFDKQLPRPKDLDKPHVRLPASWYMESLYWVIDERYSSNRATVLIANQSYDDLQIVLQAIGGTAVDAILSRFNRNNAIRLDWATTGVTEYRTEDKPLF